MISALRPFAVAATVFLTFASATPAKPDPGQPAPAFKLVALNGDSSVQLKDMAGKVVLMDFWASWCPPCRKSVPELSRLGVENPGLVILAVSVDKEAKKARKFLKGNATEGLVALHDAKQEVADKYGIEGMPSAVLIDKKGIVRFRKDGYGEGDLEKLKAEAAKLMEEKL